MSNRAGLASLRRRFPGIEDKIGRCVADMACAMANYHKPVQGWISVERANPDDPLPGSGWIAYIHAFVLETKQQITMPVILTDRIVKPDEKPQVFTYMSEAENAANQELPGLIAYVKSKL